MTFFRKLSKYYFDFGYKAIVMYRIAMMLNRNGLARLASIILRYCRLKTGVEFNKNCKIGANFKIAHAQNVVIGGSSEIGNNVTLYNGVTLGISGKLYYDETKSTLMQEAEYPQIGNNCIVYSGAKILGGITIGDNCIIGANAVVFNNAPPFSLVGGIPARVIKKIENLDLSKYKNR